MVTKQTDAAKQITYLMQYRLGRTLSDRAIDHPCLTEATPPGAASEYLNRHSVVYDAGVWHQHCAVYESIIRIFNYNSPHRKLADAGDIDARQICYSFQLLNTTSPF